MPTRSPNLRSSRYHEGLHHPEIRHCSFRARDENVKAVREFLHSADSLAAGHYVPIPHSSTCRVQVLHRTLPHVNIGIKKTVDEQSQSGIKDVWESGGAYGFFMGRWSRLVAVEFLQWLSVAPKGEWLDVGCGTGMLSQTILDLADPAKVRGIDQAPGFVSFATDHIRDPRAGFEIGSAESLTAESNTYDAVVSGLMLNFVPQGDRAVSEMRRVAKPGGIVAAYVWDYADRMQLLRHFWDAAVFLDPDVAVLDEGKRFPLCNPEKLRDLFLKQGLDDVEVRPIDVQTHFADFQDYWSPFLSGQGPAPTYVTSLTKERQAGLRERIRTELPTSTDGTINLIARAWAVRGVVR